MFGTIGRETLSAGTIIFAVAGTVCLLYTPIPTCSNRLVQGSQLLSGQQALSTLSDNGLCTMLLVLVFAAATFLISLPRTLDRLSGLAILSSFLITLSGTVAMIGAGISPKPNRMVSATHHATFYECFVAITNPVFSYAGKSIHS
jgi:hypothetical protein